MIVVKCPTIPIQSSLSLTGKPVIILLKTIRQVNLLNGIHQYTINPNKLKKWFNENYPNEELKIKSDINAK